MRALVGGALVLATLGCKREDRPADVVRAYLSPDSAPATAVSARFFERGGSGVLRYLGVDLDPPPPAIAGESLTLTHTFEIEHAFRTDPLMFVHLEDVEGRRVAVDDHEVLGGRIALSALREGERWLDRHRLLVPSDARSGAHRLFVGLFEGERRATLEAPPRRNDGRDRLWVLSVPIAGAGPPPLPSVSVARVSEAPAIDGVLDEPVWERAEVMSFSDSLGRPVPARFPTRLRLLYDDRYLYVGFEAEDEDISERYARRDDPIYEHETVELFLMPGVEAPDVGPYVELQASPTGVIFDASFSGRRQGMNTAFDAGQEVATTRRGTLNDDRPDSGWVSEWRVPFAAIPGVASAPRPGEEWRANAFRIEKYHADGKLQGEYTAWSPPRVGDFHATERFGRLRFGGEESPQ